MTSSARNSVRSPRDLILRGAGQGSTEGTDHSLSSGAFDWECRFDLGAASESSPGARQVYLSRFGMMGGGTDLKEGPTGQIGIRGTQGHGILSPEGPGWKLEAELEATVLYQAIQERFPREKIEEDVFLTPLERFAGVLTANFEPVDGGSTPTFQVSSANLSLTLQASVLGWIRSFSLQQAHPSVSFESKAIGRSRVTPTLPKGLQLRPVCFRDGQNDPSPTGSSWQDQFDNAQVLWPCIQLVPLEPHTVDSLALKTSTDLDAIRKSWTDSSDLVIEVYFVSSDLAGGGGTSLECGSGLDSVIVSDLSAADNPFLLAHELGHVLSGLHPDSKGTHYLWVADKDTVMVPRTPNLPVNSISNCARSANGALR